MIRRWLGVILCVLLSETAFAGPVNTPGSLPFALATARGDRLTIGDIKALVYWSEQGSERVAAVPWKQGWKSSDRFSGGLALASKRAGSAPAAIACGPTETQVFYPERSPAFPAGRWMDAAVNATESGVRRCAMQKNGDFAEFRSLLLINRQQRLSVPAGFQKADLVAAGGGFFLIKSASALGIFSSQATWNISNPWSHGISGLSNETRFAGNDHALVKSDPDGNAWIGIDAQRFSAPQRLPVNPCEDGQACGVSLADDDSWVISGYWGHYLGRGQQFIRLNIPLSIDKGTGAVAFAHASESGRFIYIGLDDGDQGVLPGLPKNSALRAMASRFMIWTRTGGMQVWNQSLPEVLPKDWIAWEPGYEWTIQAEPTVSGVADDRWWLDRLQAHAAQDFIRQQGWSLPTIHAAVIDSGIDPTHPLLQSRLDRKAAEIPGNGLDDDGNGFVDDSWGYDFVEEDALPQDAFGHGTHVAGLIIGQYPDDVRSPAPNLVLTVVRALDRSGKSNSIDLARALLYAAENGAEIVNCSWGGGPDTQALRDAFAVLRERGILVFSSAGNDHVDTDKSPEIPKNYPGVIAVAATDKNDQLASFSSFGKNSVRFMTPGDAIVSSVPGGILGEKSGTSMASPLAAASFALIWGVVRVLHPELNRAEQIALADQTLCKTAKKVEGRSQCGLLRLRDAVQALSL